MAKKSKIQELRDQAKRLLEQAKAEESKAYGELGKISLELIAGKLSHEEFKQKAVDLGLIETEGEI